MTSVLSIQSSVSFGYAGNSAAVFPLQRMGIEAWPVYTVAFSNHTGYGAWRGPVFDPAQVVETVRGIDDRGALAKCSALLSGYLGSPATGRAILAAHDLLQERNPEAIWCCDPVMGDVGRGFFVHEGIPDMLRDEVVPRAGLLTPNHFEMNYLAGRELTTLEDMLAAVDELRERGPRTVLVTSVATSETDPDTVQMLAVGDEGAYLVTTPKLPTAVVGSGDVTAAVFLARTLAGDDLRAALEATAGSMFSLLEQTEGMGRYEIALVDGQQQFITPTHTFSADTLR